MAKNFEGSGCTGSLLWSKSGRTTPPSYSVVAAASEDVARDAKAIQCLTRWAVVSLAALAFAAPAKAATIQLFNTGVGNIVLLPGGSTDPHYTLIASPDPALSVAFVSDLIPLADGYIPNGPSSKWIGPGVDLTVGFPAGDYVYRTTFNLTGFDPSTAVLLGGFASDNEGEIILNGVSTGITSPFVGYVAFTPFVLHGGFLSGLNTLDFRVMEEGDSPTALRVELSGTATAVLEPSTLVLLSLGLSALVSTGRSCRRIPESLLRANASPRRLYRLAAH